MTILLFSKQEMNIYNLLTKLICTEHNKEKDGTADDLINN